MPESYVEGYLGAAKYDFDRASYAIYRPLIEEAEKDYEESVRAFVQGLKDAQAGEEKKPALFYLL